MVKNSMGNLALATEKQKLEEIIQQFGNFAHVYHIHDKSQSIEIIESLFDLIQQICSNFDDNLSVYYYYRKDNSFILWEELTPNCSFFKEKMLEKINFYTADEISATTLENFFKKGFPGKHITIVSREIITSGFFLLITKHSNTVSEIILNAMRKIITAFSSKKVFYGLIKIAREILNEAGKIGVEQVIILNLRIDLSHSEAMARLAGTKDKVKHNIMEIINCPDPQQCKIIHEEYEGSIILCLNANPASLEKVITYIRQICNQFLNLDNSFPGLQITPAMDCCVVSERLDIKGKIQSVLSALNRVQNMTEQYAYYKAPVLISKAVNDFISGNIHDQAVFYIRELVLKYQADNNTSEIKELYQLAVDETFNKDFLANYNRAFALRKDNPEESERILRDLLDNSKKRDIPAQELYRECVSETLGSFY